MKAIEFSSKFNKDLKLMVKRGKPISKLKTLMDLIVKGETLGRIVN